MGQGTGGNGVRRCDSSARELSVVGATELDSHSKSLLRECSGLNGTGTFVIHENDAG